MLFSAEVGKAAQRNSQRCRKGSSVSTMISKRYKNERMTHGCVCTAMMKAMMKKMSSLSCRSTPKVDTLGPQQQALGLDQMTHLTDFRLIRLI
jgi:hypothetical protein